MAVAALSIKLRCASWQQLATIYKRDLSKGSMFLKASNQPPIGTVVRIDLELPSATVIELSGIIVKHVVDPQRGSGVDLQLEPLPTKSVWVIESALAAENKVRAQSQSEATVPPGDLPVAEGARALNEGQDVAAAETQLVAALEEECEALRKLNPFLVLAVPYDATDDAVRSAFGELTKRYHPDRYARYQSVKLRQLAAELFIIIRDAYRKLADATSRQAALSQIGGRTTPRIQTQPKVSPSPPRPGSVQRIPTGPPMPPLAKPDPHETPTAQRPVLPEAPTKQGPYDAPTHQSGKTAELAGTELAKGDDLSVPIARGGVDTKAPTRMPAMPPRSTQPIPAAIIPPAATAPTLPPPLPSGQHDAVDGASLESLMDVGKLEDALAGYRALVKKQPTDRSARAGVELCEGLAALANRDRMEAAQRFEAALELDPSNERAARELAEMRRHATNERKGLLSHLMGKKEPPP